VTQKEIIKNYLLECRENGDDWLLGGKIRSIETENGFIGFRGDRDCRDLFRDKKIFARENEKGLVEYKYKYSWEKWVDKDFWKNNQKTLL